MTDALHPTDHRAQAYVLAPGDVRRNPTVSPGVKADATDTAGLLSVFQDTLAPWQSGPPLHLHGEMDEAFYVLEGTLVVQLGDEEREVTTGSFVWIPRGTPHAFANASGSATRLLSVAVPSGIEEFFAERQQYFDQLDGPPDLAILGRIGTHHGSRLLGPPIEVRAPAARAS
ncbi:MAG TPA: cupin domain-containing protein [Chloroflexota bacterium]|nr:cupin domain-containing protein [Chloroflexota bacterium]